MLIPGRTDFGNDSAWRLAWPILVLNLLFIGFYYSGSAFLQGLITPRIEGLEPQQHREFGLLELAQNVFILGTLFVYAAQLRQPRTRVEKGLFLAAVMVSLFIFLEEIDYGMHLWEFFSGHDIDLEYFNLHNQGETGTLMKSLNDAVMLLGFVLLPLLRYIPAVDRFCARFPLAPVRAFFLVGVVAVLCSRLAHGLDDMGYGIIDGRQGTLWKAVGEFREMSVYYIYLLYALQLSRAPNLFRNPVRPAN